MDVVFRENCSLDKINLYHVAFPMLISRLPQQAVKNSSLKTLIMMESNLNSSAAAYIAKGFKSLTYLDFQENQISDLAPFDDLLLGHDAKLESLIIYSNPISEEDFLVFLKKLPRMQSLRELDIQDLPFLESKHCRDAILEALWGNTSLENVCCCGDDDGNQRCGGEKSDQENDDLEEFRTLLAVPLSLNRGGRRELQNLPTNSLPRSLWAQVLHRAMTIKYCSAWDHWDTPENTALRSDVVYWLLRNKFLV